MNDYESEYADAPRPRRVRRQRVESGRPVVSERLGVSVGESEALLWLAEIIANGRTNPLGLLDPLAELWRGFAREMDAPV